MSSVIPGYVKPGINVKSGISCSEHQPLGFAGRLRGSVYRMKTAHSGFNVADLGSTYPPDKKGDSNCSYTICTLFPRIMLRNSIKHFMNMFGMLLTCSQCDCWSHTSFYGPILMNISLSARNAKHWFFENSQNLQKMRDTRGVYETPSRTLGTPKSLCYANESNTGQKQKSAWKILN